MDPMDHFGEIFSLLARKLKILWQGIKLHESGSCFKMKKMDPKDYFGEIFGLLAQTVKILWQGIKLDETGSCVKMKVWTSESTLVNFQPPSSKTKDFMAGYQIT